MMKNLRIWIKCPEIRFQIAYYWLLYFVQVLTIVIFLPLLVVVVIFSYVASMLETMANIVVVPYEKIIEYVEEHRSQAIKHAHSIISIDMIQERTKKDHDT